MSQKQVSEKREKSAAEIFAVVVMVMVFMAVFISYFMKQSQQISEVGYSTLANNFAAQVNAIHAQWMMDGKPDNVNVSSLYETNKKSVGVNKRGWVKGQAKNEVSTCRYIWQQVLNQPMTYMRTPIAAVVINDISNTNNKNISISIDYNVCRYVLNTENYFDYNSQNGKVNIVSSN